MLERERNLWARCAEPQTEEVFYGILRWHFDSGLAEFEITSPLAQLLGEHHSSFTGHKHGNFGLFMTEQLAIAPRVEFKSEELANLKLVFPTSIGALTVARMHDRDAKFIGFRVYGFIEPRGK